MRRRRFALGAAAVVLGLGATACGAAPTSPSAGTDVRRLRLTAEVRSDGAVAGRTDAAFTDDDGTLVIEAPPIATISEVIVDGTPTSAGSDRAELRSSGSDLTATWTVTGSTERWQDVAQVTIPLWSGVGGARLAAPALRARVELRLPAEAIDVQVVGARATSAAVGTGTTTTFEVDIVPRLDASLVVALPAAAVPDAALVRDEARGDYLAGRRAIRSRATAARLADVDDARDRARLIDAGYWGLVGLEVAVPFLITVTRLAGAGRRRLRAAVGVPEVVREPPSDDHPAVVALLARDAHDIGDEAVAATVLDLAGRGVVELQPRPGGAWSLTVTGSSQRPEEADLVAALTTAVGRGTADGPPLPVGRGRWWRSMRRATVRSALAAGYVRRRYPAALFRTAVVALALTTAPLWFTSPGAALAGFGVAAFLAVLPSVGGLVLTDAGSRARAEWLAHGRHLRENADLGDVDPAGVAIWGRNLALAAALGEAPTAVRGLAPRRDGSRAPVAVALAVVLVPVLTAVATTVATGPPAWGQAACEIGSRGDFKASRARTVQGRFAGRDFSCQDLSGVDFGQADLTGANFTRARLDGADLIQAELRSAVFNAGSLRGARLGQADATGAQFHHADLTDADFTQTTLTDAQLPGADLTDARLGQAHLERADLTGAVLAGADLTQATVDGARLAGANLAGIDPGDVLAADRTGTPFAPATSFAPAECAVGSKTTFRETVTDPSRPVGKLAGLDLSCQDLSSLRISFADFTGANLNRARLKGLELFSAEFGGASLIGADLSGAALSSAKLAQVDLRDADLSRARLTSATLAKADARGATFDRADLSNADLSEADLSGASFAGAQLAGAKATGAVWADADMAGARQIGAMTGAELDGARNLPVNPIRRWWPYLLGAVLLVVLLTVFVRRSRGIAADA